MFQQDSAQAHRARDTIQLLQQETPDFIGPDLSPPNSPDLNPVDYKIWGVMQQRVYERRMTIVTSVTDEALGNGIRSGSSSIIPVSKSLLVQTKKQAEAVASSCLVLVTPMDGIPI